MATKNTFVKKGLQIAKKKPVTRVIAALTEYAGWNINRGGGRISFGCGDVDIPVADLRKAIVILEGGFAKTHNAITSELNDIYNNVDTDDLSEVLDYINMSTRIAKLSTPKYLKALEFMKGFVYQFDTGHFDFSDLLRENPRNLRLIIGPLRLTTK